MRAFALCRCTVQTRKKRKCTVASPASYVTYLLALTGRFFSNESPNNYSCHQQLPSFPLDGSNAIAAFINLFAIPSS